MYNVEIHSGISRIMNVFYRCGMWRFGNGKENLFIAFVRKSAFRMWSTSLAVTYASEAFQNPDKSNAIYSGVCAIIASVLIVKLENVLNKRKEINEFLRQLCVHCLTDCNDFMETVVKLNQFVRLIHIFLVSVLAGIISLLIAPALTSEKSLPIYLWLPFGWRDSTTGYCVSYAYLVCTMLYSMIPISFTVIIWYIMLNCSVKYKLLESQLRNMEPEMEQQQQQLSHQKFILLIKEHRNIKEYLSRYWMNKVRSALAFFLIDFYRCSPMLNTIDRFKSCFENLFFIQINTSGIGICFSIYILAFSRDLNMTQSGAAVATLIYNVFDIYVVMHYGNEIKLSSNRLTYGLFESNWMAQTKSVKKCMLIFSEAAKQPHELLIGKLYPLNLQTFTSILKFAYSSLNILKNVR